MASNSPWTWSPEHQDYYYVTRDPYGQVSYHWAREQMQLAGRTDLVAVAAQQPLEISETEKSKLSQGWYEPLDQSYRMRTATEAYSFFHVGKVFAILHIQAASAQACDSENSTVVQYGERAFSQIRRFVIVDVRHGFVYACPISTYSHRATTKSGIISSEHSTVYFEGTTPVIYPGEIGLKDPICIIPADPSLRMHEASRLHYAKVWPIETNVKARDIGDVHPEHLSDLIRNYKEENDLALPSKQSVPPIHSSGMVYHPGYGA